MEIRTNAEQAIEKEVKNCGSGAHVLVPKAWHGRRVQVLLLPEAP